MVRCRIIIFLPVQGIRPPNFTQLSASHGASCFLKSSWWPSLNSLVSKRVSLTLRSGRVEGRWTCFVPELGGCWGPHCHGLLGLTSQVQLSTRHTCRRRSPDGRKGRLGQGTKSCKGRAWEVTMVDIVGALSARRGSRPGLGHSRPRLERMHQGISYLSLRSTRSLRRK